MAVVVLFTCAGQRVDIVTAFARTGATTLAADVNELAPALYAAERRASVPRVDDPAYVDALRRPSCRVTVWKSSARFGATVTVSWPSVVGREAPFRYVVQAPAERSLAVSPIVPAGVAIAYPP